ncbi:MAG TPA: SDR family oxidoreductase [Pirellulales bacterium]|jgi:NAD(P)-dependent dehydrogenase (short-subunit alcohol dehydrogenase family)
MTSNPFQLPGRRVIITGASSGIGRATAVKCAELGATVVCLGRNEERLQETVTSLAGSGHSHRTIDVDDADALTRTIETIAAEGGPLGGIVHSAGVQRVTPLRIAKAEDFLSQYRTNALSAAAILAAVAKRKVADPNGASVVLVGSVMSVLGAAGLAAYCSSKSALTGLVQAGALELATARIRVNAVLPGVVETEMSQKYLAALAEDQVQAIRSKHPLGLGQAEDVALSIVFLLGDAARWITGTCLTVDGGYSAQ